MPELRTQPPDGLWYYEYITPDLIQAERLNDVLYSGRTPYQEVSVIEVACFGRSLVLDGKTQSTEADEFVYHEALVQPSMTAHPEPREVFVAGGGEGATIREVLSHESVNRVVMVDIDEDVVEVCRRYLPDHHRDAFDDPRLELHHTDALQFLEQTEDRFDVAIIDVPDPLEGGPAVMLFTQEFHNLLRDRLNPGGLVVAQSGPTGPAYYEQCFSAVANTVGSVFPSVYLSEAFVPSFGSTWGFVIGSLGPNLLAASAEEVDRRIAARVKGDLRFYDGITHRGMFSVPKYLRRAVAADRRIITRADPLFVF